MAIEKTTYGTVETHRGTYAEVALSINGYPPTHILSVFYDGTSVVALTRLYQK